MDAFAQRLEDRLHKKITITKNSQECLEGADIMVEATRLMGAAAPAQDRMGASGQLCRSLRYHLCQ